MKNIHYYVSAAIGALVLLMLAWQQVGSALDYGLSSYLTVRHLLRVLQEAALPLGAGIYLLSKICLIEQTGKN